MIFSKKEFGRRRWPDGGRCLVAAIFLAIQWIAYLFIMNARPEWVRDMWGPNLDWPFVQNVWFWMMAIFKLLRLDDGDDRDLADTLGAGTAKTDDRFGTLKTLLSQIVRRTRRDAMRTNIEVGWRDISNTV